MHHQLCILITISSHLISDYNYNIINIFNLLRTEWTSLNPGWKLIDVNLNVYKRVHSYGKTFWECPQQMNFKKLDFLGMSVPVEKEVMWGEVDLCGKLSLRGAELQWHRSQPFNRLIMLEPLQRVFPKLWPHEREFRVAGLPTLTPDWSQIHPARQHRERRMLSVVTHS